MTGGQGRVVRHDAQLLLPGERLLAELVPATVELAFVFVRPFLRNVMGRVGRARREIHHERLVRHQHLLLAHPGDGAIGEVLGERIALLRSLGRLHSGRAFVKPGKVLVRFAADEAIKMLKSGAGRPLVERPYGRDLPVRHLVALAELRRRIPVELQDLRQRRLFLGPDAVVAWSRRRHLGDRAHADRMMVSTGENAPGATASTKQSYGTGYTSNRWPQGARRWACCTVRQTRSRRRSQHRQGARSTHSARLSGGRNGTIGGYLVLGSLAS